MAYLPFSAPAGAAQTFSYTRIPAERPGSSTARLGDVVVTQQPGRRSLECPKGELPSRSRSAKVTPVDLDGVVGSAWTGLSITLGIDHVAGRIDLDAIAARLHLDAIAARLDVNAVVDRVDLAGVTERVLDEVGVGHIMRESSGAMAAESLDAVRLSLRVKSRDESWRASEVIP